MDSFLELNTCNAKFVLPCLPGPLKDAISRYRLSAKNIIFVSEREKNAVVRRLFLIAVIDEMENKGGASFNTSPIAEFAREFLH